jgi:hypothetical protein
MIRTQGGRFSLPGSVIGLQPGPMKPETYQNATRPMTMKKEKEIYE